MWGKEAMTPFLTNDFKEVKDDFQVAPKGGQCYTVERTAKLRTARWYKLNSKKEVNKHDQKNSLLPQSYYVTKEGSPMNSFTRETLFWKHGFNFAGI